MKPFSSNRRLVPRLSFSTFLGLIALEALAVVVYYLLLPADPKNGILFGFSAFRLGLIGIFTLAAILLGLVAFHVNRNTSHVVPALARKHTPWKLQLVMWDGLILGFASLTALAYPMELLEEQYHALWIRLIPIFLWVMLVSFEIFVLLLIRQYGFSWNSISDRKTLRLWAGIALVFGALWAIIGWTHTGQMPDQVSWRELGSPILAWQFCLAVLVGWAAYGLITRILRTKPGSLPWIDVGLMLCLYGLALWLWLGQPLQNSYFSPEARLPNYEVYPYSDALYYNLAAESVTIGEGLSMHTVTPRPLYLTILSYFVHFTGGQYPQIIILQTGWLALIPVVLFLLGKCLIHRGVGITLGLLAIFREAVAIRATPDIQLSNSKLIMADLPTLLALLVLCYLAVGWLQGKKPVGLRLTPLWVGASLGALMLFRTQAVILLPFLLLLAIFQYRGSFKRWWPEAALLVLGCVLVVCPWLVRNYALTGQVMFDDPTTQTSLLQSRYQLEDAGSDSESGIWSAFVQNPGGVIGFISNHFFRNLIGTVMVTPPQRLIDTWPLLFEQTPFWRSDVITLDFWQGLVLAGILGLMALGLASMLQRMGWVGLIPLIFNFSYTLGNGLARNSGGRYNLPVDWVGYFYLVIGFYQLFVWVLDTLGNREVPDQEIVNEKWIGTSISWRKAVLSGFGIILFGAWIPLTEIVFPERYPTVSGESAKEIVSEWGVSQPDLLADLTSGEKTIHFGRELFPRFYRPGDGEQGSNWAAYAPLDFCRMGFELIDTSQIGGVVVMLDRPPQQFPNRVDAIVIGKETNVLVKNKQVPVLLADWVVLHTDPVVVIKGLQEPAERCRLKP